MNIFLLFVWMKVVNNTCGKHARSFPWNKKQDYKNAISQWEKALEYIPKDAEVHNFMGIAYHRLGKLDSSIVEYQRAISLKPDYYQAWNNLGYILFFKGDYAQALEKFRKALQINPQYQQAQLNYRTSKAIMDGKLSLKAFELVENAAKIDSLEFQIKNFRRALQIDSNYVDAWNNLGVAYYYYGNIDSAAICLKKALELNPENPEVLNNIAYLLDFNGDYQAAIFYYQKALKIRPDYLTAMSNLGDAYLHAGDRESAQKIWEGALKLAPEDIWIKRKLAKLNQESGEEP